MKKLFYLPLEPYIERYTYLMSCEDGWAENHFNNLGVDFVRVDGEKLGTTIKTGKVVDAHGRSYYALSQIMKVVKLLHEGAIEDGDIVYVEDFWHPGIESLFYIRHLTGIDFKIGTFLHAQSVDDTDFSYDMREWMRPIEQGYGKGYDYIFVTSEILRRLCIGAQIGNDNSVINVGLPYNSRRLLEQLEEMGFVQPVKQDYVIFSSRFDDEKDPMFFLDLVERCKDIKFKLVRPREVITSNHEVLGRLDHILATQDNLEIVDTRRSKLDYYTALAGAKVQFNCAHQDWVSWTLLEAITFKCNPLYPVWKDFPIELWHDERYLYEKCNIDDCEKKLRALMQSEFDTSLDHVVRKHDASWLNYLYSMNYWEETNV